MAANGTVAGCGDLLRMRNPGMWCYMKRRGSPPRRFCLCAPEKRRAAAVRSLPLRAQHRPKLCARHLVKVKEAPVPQHCPTPAPFREASGPAVAVWVGLNYR